MQEIAINWIALIVAVIVKQAIGALWFSPFAFGPAWCALAGVSEAEMRARLPRVLPIEFVATIVMAFVLVHAIRYAGADGFLLGGVVGFLNWLGFVAASRLNDVLYEKRPLNLFAIDVGYWLVGLVAMGAILGGWR